MYPGCILIKIVSQMYLKCSVTYHASVCRPYPAPSSQHRWTGMPLSCRSSPMVTQSACCRPVRVRRTLAPAHLGKEDVLVEGLLEAGGGRRDDQGGCLGDEQIPRTGTGLQRPSRFQIPRLSPRILRVEQIPTSQFPDIAVQNPDLIAPLPAPWDLGIEREP